ELAARCLTPLGVRHPRRQRGWCQELAVRCLTPLGVRHPPAPERAVSGACGSVSDTLWVSDTPRRRRGWRQELAVRWLTPLGVRHPPGACAGGVGGLQLGV